MISSESTSTGGLDHRMEFNGTPMERIQKNEINEWLNSPDWTHIGTLTHPHQIGVFGLRNQFRWFIRRLENFNQTKVNWFYEIERTTPTHLHIHFLLGNIRKVSIDRMKNLWFEKTGSIQNRISLFDHDRVLEGIGYTTKEILSRDHSLDWDLNLKGMTNHHSNRSENQLNQTQENHP